MNKELESLMEHAEGVGVGILLLVVGLVLTIGGYGPGPMVGGPLMAGALLYPLAKTHQAKTEADYQATRRRPEQGNNKTYSIDSKSSRRKRG